MKIIKDKVHYNANSCGNSCPYYELLQHEMAFYICGHPTLDKKSFHSSLFERSFTGNFPSKCPLNIKMDFKSILNIKD